jgi:hypothetical protein
MRRFGRWLFNGLAVVSTLLCAVLVAICLRNWSQFELVGVVRDGWSGTQRYQAKSISVSAAKGNFYFSFDGWGYDFAHSDSITDLSISETMYRKMNPGEIRLVHRHSYPTAGYSLLPDHGFSRYSHSTGTPGEWEWDTEMSLPAWLAITTLAALPVTWAVLAWGAHRRRRRADSGLCIACGYDLHGNLSGVCPECGTPITQI